MYTETEDIFDLDRVLTFMDKELLEIIPDRERKKGKRIADLLVKVYLKDGTEKWILVHTEIDRKPYRRTSSLKTNWRSNGVLSRVR